MKKKIIWISIVIAVFLVGGWVWFQYDDVRGPGLIVLLYHRVSNDKNLNNKYTLTTEEFERQLQWLKENSYKSILPREISGHVFQKNPEKTFMLTFDDGTIDHFETVYPLLKKYGFGGVFFVVTKEIMGRGRLKNEHLKEMSDNGMEIGSHTVSHPFLDTLSDDEIDAQLINSKRYIELQTSKKVIALAPPGGWFDKRVEAQAKKRGFEFLFSCEIGLNDLTTSPFVYKRVEVLRGVSIEEFQDLLTPVKSFFYKLKQSCKFIVHDLIGSKNYQKLSHAY